MTAAAAGALAVLPLCLGTYAWARACCRARRAMRAAMVTEAAYSSMPKPQPNSRQWMRCRAARDDSTRAADHHRQVVRSGWWLLPVLAMVGACVYQALTL